MEIEATQVNIRIFVSLLAKLRVEFRSLEIHSGNMRACQNGQEVWCLTHPKERCYKQLKNNRNRECATNQQNQCINKRLPKNVRSKHGCLKN